jgi:hypothetical protein
MATRFLALSLMLMAGGCHDWSAFEREPSTNEKQTTTPNVEQTKRTEEAPPSSSTPTPPPKTTTPTFYVLMGDWNGDGVDTPAHFHTATGHWSMSDHNTQTDIQHQFDFGGPDVLPLAGDWDSDGIDSAIIYKPTSHEWQFKSRNDDTAEGGRFIWGVGDSTMVPVVGDWDGDGFDTLGFYDPATFSWFLSNKHIASGPPGEYDILTTHGEPGCIPFVGDWDGDGTDTPAFYNPSTGVWNLKLRDGVPDVIFTWRSRGGDFFPLSGRFEKSATVATIGVFRPKGREWELALRNEPNAANHMFDWGPPGTFSVVGGPIFSGL